MIDTEDYPPLTKQVREAILSIIEENGLSQREFARFMGVSEAQISKYLRSPNKASLNSKAIERLFNSLGYHPVISYTKIKSGKGQPDV